jgi:ComF family protein
MNKKSFSAVFWGCQIRAVFFLQFCAYALLTFLLGAESCVRCGKTCRVLPLCKTCRKKMVRRQASGNRCKLCGKTLISEISVCMECRTQADKQDRGGEPEKKSVLDSCFPIFSYHLWRRELLYLWKGRGVRLFTPFFAAILAQALTEELHISGNTDATDLPVIVPVPPRPGKIREKGWDQVEDLCKWLERYYGFTVARLLKRRSSAQQKKLDRAHRLENAQNAYFLSQRGAKNMPKNSILLDDVRTTGATLEMCALALKHSGCQTVRGLVLFGVE